MGQALAAEKAGRLAEAVAQNRRAVAAAPEEVPAQRELVSRLMKLKEFGQAIAACREALGVAPSDSELHTLLGMALLRQTSPASKQTEEAFGHLRLACRLAVNSFLAFDKLAWVLATYPEARWRNGVEAVQLAERVCEQTEFRLPETVGTLAVAYAEAGRFPEAINAAQRAQTLYRALGQTQMVDLQEERVKLFREGRAYRANE
jgi:tetratricopeptide (TPR) repeat protein